MSDKTKYAEAKFVEAVHELTLGIGDIKERVKCAYFKFHILSKNDFPKHLKDDYEWIITKLTKKPALKAKYSKTIISGSIDQTMHHMKRKTALKIAEKIVYLKTKLSEFNSEQ
jgi:hypothetical protein